MSFDKIKYLCFSKLFLSMTTAKKAAYLGVFVALSIVVNTFSIDVTPSNKISFTYLIGFFSGCYFGGIGGFIVMWLGDLIAFLFSPSGSIYWPLTGISTGMLGLIPGIVMNLAPLKIKGGVFIKTAVSCILMYLLVTCGVGAIANYLYVKIQVYQGVYAKTFWAYLAGKIAFQSLVAFGNYALVFVLIPTLNAIKPLKIKIE